MQKLLSSRNLVFFLFNSELASRAASSNAVVIYSFLQITEKNHYLGGKKKPRRKKRILQYSHFLSKLCLKQYYTVHLSFHFLENTVDYYLQKQQPSHCIMSYLLAGKKKGFLMMFLCSVCFPNNMKEISDLIQTQASWNSSSSLLFHSSSRQITKHFC